MSGEREEKELTQIVVGAFFLGWFVGLIMSYCVLAVLRAF